MGEGFENLFTYKKDRGKETNTGRKRVVEADEVKERDVLTLTLL